MARIVVIDDDKDILNFCRHVLEKYGHEVVLLQNPSNFLKLIDNHNFSMIILDVKMPEYSGLDILKEIRKNEHRPTPIMMLTGERSKDTVLRSVSLGAIDYFVKPFTAKELSKRVDTILSNTKNFPSIGYNKLEEVAEIDLEIFRSDGQEYIKGKLYEISELSFTLMIEGKNIIAPGTKIILRSEFFEKMRLLSYELNLNCFNYKPMPNNECFLISISTIKIDNYLIMKNLKDWIRDYGAQ